MAGTRFEKATLISEISGRYDDLIAEQQKLVDADKAVTDTERVERWRERETKRVLDFARELRAGRVTDIQLGNFETKRAPDVGGHRYYSDTSTAERDVERLQKSLKKILVYVRSLAETEPGVVEVSAADLKRIGYSL